MIIMQFILPITTAILYFSKALLVLISTSNVSAMDSKGCYQSGMTWDELGTWHEISEALRISSIFNLTAIGSDTATVSRNSNLQNASNSIADDP